MALRRLANQDDDRDRFPIVAFSIIHIGGTFLAVFLAGLLLLFVARLYLQDAANTAANEMQKATEKLQKEIDKKAIRKPESPE